jgi:hypothetical protein
MVYLVTKTKKAMVSLETIAHILPPLEKLIKPEVQLEGDLAAPPTDRSVKTGILTPAHAERNDRRSNNGAV